MGEHCVILFRQEYLRRSILKKKTLLAWQTEWQNNYRQARRLTNQSYTWHKAVHNTLMSYIQVEQRRHGLKLSNLMSSDSGNYTCVVFNRHGQLHHTYVIDVFGKLRAKHSRSTIWYDVNGLKSWRCGQLDLAHVITKQNTGWPPKSKPQSFVHIFVKYWPILGIFFTGTFCGKFVIKWLLNIPPHHNWVATLPCEIWNM